MLCLLVLHHRFYRFISTVTHISGDTNSMADDASRLWNLSHKGLIVHFNVTNPQVWSWKLAALRPRMHYVLISFFCKRISTKRLFPLEPEQTNVASGNGKSSAGRTLGKPSLIQYRTWPYFSKNLPARLEAAYLLTTGSQSAHVLLRSTSGQYVRRLPKWVSGIPASTSRVV